MINPNDIPLIFFKHYQKLIIFPRFDMSLVPFYEHESPILQSHTPNSIQTPIKNTLPLDFPSCLAVHSLTIYLLDLIPATT